MALPAPDGGGTALHGFLGGFSSAEAASEEAIDLVLKEGGQQLYQAYIERKSFTFASDAISNYVLSELKMSFVRHDSGEPAPPLDRLGNSGIPSSPASAAIALERAASGQGNAPRPGPGERREGWELEPEPGRSRIDTWARACVPIRKKLVRPRNASPAEVRKANVKSSVRSVSNRSPSRQISPPGVAPEPGDAAKAEKSRQMIPLVEEQEEDEDETMMRDMKDREARRRRDEETRLQRKAQDEAEEAAKLGKVKDQMKDKPFTYDSGGDIIWIEPVKTERLPATNPVPAYSFKTEVVGEAGKAAMAAAKKMPQGGGPSASGSAGQRPRGRSQTKEKEKFVDGFTKCGKQQPAMMEVMSVAPGVTLNERGAAKRGAAKLGDGKGIGQPMTRKDYEAMVEHGVAGPRGQQREPEIATSGRALAAAPRDLLEPSLGAIQDENPAVLPNRSGAGEREGSGLRTVQGNDVGASLVPHAPPAPRPVQPVAPPNVRRMQMKREALGYNMSTRDRPPKSGTLSARPDFRCGAQPPVGATMGHGLLPHGQRHEEYYFPHAADPVKASPRVEESDDLPSVHSGQLVTKNPELLKRLFAS